MNAVLTRTVAIIAAVLYLCAADYAHGRDKTDEITLKNGSFIIGEIKKLEAGVLEVSTNDMGYLKIEWVAVGRIQSSQFFDIDTADGSSLTGAMSPAENAGTCTITGPGGPNEVALLDVVRIAELEHTFWSRWSGHTDAGFAYGSANNQNDLTIDNEATYTTESYRLLNTLAGTLSDRDNAERTSRVSLVSTYQHNLRNRYFWLTSLDLSRNEELDLDMRAGIMGAYGRDVLQSSRSRFGLAAGLSANREKYFLKEGAWNWEALLTARYGLFLFEGHETTLTTTLQVFPSLTDSGRYRVEFISSLRRKLVRDFTLALTLEESYDSRPPDATIEKSDMRFRTTIGWSF